MGYDDCHVDTYGALTDSVHTTPAEFFKALRIHLTARPAFAKVARPSLPAVFDALSDAFRGCDFHISNGTAIRYAQYMRFDAQVESNRGVSGIEGSTSTAIGAAMATGRPTVLVTGDMSAAYDIGALAVAGIPPTFRMVVLDNGGGDIFRAVATTRGLPECEERFVAAPVLPLRQLAAAYGFEYFETDADSSDLKSFAEASGRPAILRVRLQPKQANNIL